MSGDGRVMVLLNCLYSINGMSYIFIYFNLVSYLFISFKSDAGYASIDISNGGKYNLLIYYNLYYIVCANIISIILLYK